MWRLKIGEGNEEVDPYLFSSNNFVGRQTWEFDPKAGTQEERAAVEEARQRYLDNRSRVKGCSDLFWRMQFLKEAKFEQLIPPVKIDDDEGITYEKATIALRRGVSFFSALQASDGHWPGEITGPLFFLTPLRLIGHYSRIGIWWVFIFHDQFPSRRHEMLESTSSSKSLSKFHMYW